MMIFISEFRKGRCSPDIGYLSPAALRLQPLILDPKTDEAPPFSEFSFISRSNRNSSSLTRSLRLYRNSLPPSLSTHRIIMYERSDIVLIGVRLNSSAYSSFQLSQRLTYKPVSSKLASPIVDPLLETLSFCSETAPGVQISKDG
ncbi:hypothetical protein C1H46_020792 [Malus baccata]|uniref:Uncharacterized protein n=1 Tax=Malus baccata TaxID=106549 RepID=A0A540M4A7_MALBA|nr:hypothetical protein C1H46_020792 [Malus baccata]